jgi:FlgD Ig-like domain
MFFLSCDRAGLLDPTDHSSSPSVPSVTLEVDTSIHESRVPNYFELMQPYPNPTDGPVAINFSVPLASFIAVVVQNPVGDIVKVLVAQNLSAGYYRIDWEGRNEIGNFLRNGDYFVTLQAGSFAQSRILKIER